MWYNYIRRKAYLICDGTVTTLDFQLGVFMFWEDLKYATHDDGFPGHIFLDAHQSAPNHSSAYLMHSHLFAFSKRTSHTSLCECEKFTANWHEILSANLLDAFNRRVKICRIFLPSCSFNVFRPLLNNEYPTIRANQNSKDL